jgi:hypothetical protein
MTPSNPKHFSRGHRSAINFLAAPQCSVHSFMCYAKITPAALHCNDVGLTMIGASEAAGGMREFALSDFGASSPAWRCRPHKRSG